MKWKTLAVALSLVSVLACKKETPEGGAGQPAAAAKVAKEGGAFNYGWFPATSQLLVNLSFSGLQKSALWADAQPELEKQGGADLKEIKDLCGFDPFTKFDGVAVGGAPDDEKNLIAVVGTRDLPKAQATDCLKKVTEKEGGTFSEADGVLHFKSDGEEMVGTWIDDNHLMLGSQAGFPDAKLKECAAGKCGLTADSAVAKMFQAVAADATIKVAYVGPQLAELTPGAQGLLSGITLAEGLDIKGTMRFDTAANSKAAADKLTMGINQFKPMLGELSKVADKLKIEAKEADTNLAINLSKAELDEIKKTANQMMGGMLGAPAAAPAAPEAAAPSEKAK